MSGVRVGGSYSIGDPPPSAGRRAPPTPPPSPGQLATTPNHATKIIPTKTAWLKLSGKFPMGPGIPPLKIKIMLESNPLTSRMLVRKLAVLPWSGPQR